MRPLLAGAALFAALLTLPMICRAEAPARFIAVRNWPRARGGSAPSYQRAQVSAVATDAQGTVYVFQRARTPVLVFSRDGRFLRAWGSRQFSTPHGCRVDPQGNVWLTDLDRHQVLKFSPDGRRLAAYGVRGKPGRDATHFNEPADVAFGPAGDVYVADGYGNHRVVQLGPDGRFVRAWGRRGDGPGEFNLVHGIAADAQGRVYVADRENRRIQVFTGDGELIDIWRHFERPFALHVAGDLLYVADGTGDTFSVYTLSGRFVRRYRPSPIDVAHMICVDDQGAVYVADLDGGKVQKFTAR